jgi:peptidoglycan/LPS O-acetylase OafA/YrhL
MNRFFSFLSLSRLRRITSGENYVPEIDGVRFVAIMCVLIQHLHERVLRRTGAYYPDIPETLFHTAGAGVSVFFALSGLILYRGLANSVSRTGTVNLKSYFIRRLTRLEPPYVIVMTALLCYLVFVGYNSPHVRRLNSGPDSLFVAYLASLTYSYCMIFGALPKINGVAWSLEIEVQFYVLAPVIAVLMYRSKLRTRALIFCVIAFAWAFAVTPIAYSNLHSRWTLLTCLPYFLAGIAVEEYCRNHSGNPVSALVGSFADIVGLGALVILATVQLSPESPWPSTLKVLLVLGALWGMLHGLVWRRILSIPWISVIGGMCYTIYLIHMPILELGANLTSKVGAGLPYSIYLMIQFCLLLPVVLVASMIFYGIIERPCMNKNWPNDLAKAVSRRLRRT